MHDDSQQCGCGVEATHSVAVQVTVVRCPADVEHTSMARRVYCCASCWQATAEYLTLHVNKLRERQLAQPR